MKASIALASGEGKLTTADELRIARAVSEGLVEGIVRLAILTILVPFATLAFVLVCISFPAETASVRLWLIVAGVLMLPWALRRVSLLVLKARVRWRWVGYVI